MHYFDIELVVVVEGHCRNLEVAERHAMSHRACMGRWASTNPRFPIPDPGAYPTGPAPLARFGVRVVLVPPV